MKKLWERIKVGLWRFFISTWHVWLGAIVGVILSLIIHGRLVDGVIFWAIFGAIGLVTAYVFGRQIWWFISGTGDYIGRRGLLKRLWELIFDKKDVEDSNS